MTLSEVFTDFYARKVWGTAPVSGPGSTLEATAAIRAFLPGLVETLRVSTILDLACGDYSWFKEIVFTDPVKTIMYIGADIVPALARANQIAYGDAWHVFVTKDITCDELPWANLVLCRDCLIHLANFQITQALANIKSSGSTYLLTTSFMDQGDNPDIEPGAFHPVNLQAAPFNLPAPMLAFQEPASRDAWPDKCLALWAIKDMPL